jgi:hypothetical protein
MGYATGDSRFGQVAYLPNNSASGAIKHLKQKGYQLKTIKYTTHTMILCASHQLKWAMQEYNQYQKGEK